MPAYLVAVFTCADLAAAKAVWGNLDPNDCAEGEAKITIHDTPPVVLGGLVRGGEYASVGEWFASESPSEVLYLSADGRIVRAYNDAAAAESRGALPFTYYRSAKAPPVATDDATKIARVVAALDDEPVTDAEARETCDRIGIDVPAWAAKVRAKVARHALAEALLGIEATTVDEYRDRAHALAMNWKLEE